MCEICRAEKIYDASLKDPQDVSKKRRFAHDLGTLNKITKQTYNDFFGVEKSISLKH